MPHTLDDHHGHFFFGALESSLTGSIQGPPGPGPSSSLADGGFGFDDVFALPEEPGAADIGDELARELGEGWGGSIMSPQQECV